MKKLLLSVFVAILMIASVGLVACGEETPPTPDIHNHSFTDTVIAPTCMEKGYTTHTCSCGEVVKDAEVAALGHDFGEYISDNNATTEADGTKTRTCSRCSEKETVADEGSKLPPAHVHDFANSAKYASDGTSHWKICKDCDVEDTEHKVNCSGGTATCVTLAICETCSNAYGTVDQNAHDLEQAPAQEVNCIQAGWAAYDYCTRQGCNYDNKSETPALGHDFTSGNDYVQLENDLQHCKKCSRCSELDTEHPINCSGGTANVDTPATCPTCGESYGSALAQYTITYEGIDNANWETGYTAPATQVQGTAVTLPTAANISREGHTFAGWSVEGASSSGIITQVPADNDGAITLVANWTLDNDYYRIKYVYTAGNFNELSTGITSFKASEVSDIKAFIKSLKQIEPKNDNNYVTWQYGSPATDVDTLTEISTLTASTSKAIASDGVQEITLTVSSERLAWAGPY